MAQEDRRAGLKHECELPRPEDEFSRAQNFQTGLCLGFKRAFMWTIIIWRYNALSTKTYKSDYAIKRANIVHLCTVNLVIHPFSFFRFVWEVIMLVVFSIMYLSPITKFLQLTGVQHYFTFLVLFNIIDIILTFNTGYLIEKTGQIVMSRRLICYAYFAQWFFVDLISLGGFISFSAEFISTRVEILQFLILLRLPRCNKYLENLETFFDALNPRTYNMNFIFNVVVLYVWTAHLYCFTSYVTDDMPPAEKKKMFLFLVVRFFNGLYLFGNTFVDDTVLFIYFDILAFICGMVLQLYIMGYILRRFGKYLRRHHDYNITLKHIQNYATCIGMPARTLHRCNDYMEHIFKQRKLSEKRIMTHMSKTLRREMCCYIYTNLLEKAPIFKNIPMDVLYKLTLRLTSGIYMPEDVIIMVGEKAEQLYFIKSGRVAIYTHSGKEASHLGDGACFGELMVIDASKRNATVIAIDWCEIVVLKRDEFFEVMQYYPDLLKQIKNTIIRRSGVAIHTTQNLPSSDTESILTDSSLSSVVAI